MNPGSVKNDAKVATRLVTKPDAPATLTARKDSHLLNALKRGMGEYLVKLEASEGGRLVAFKRIYWDVAEWESRADFPTAFIDAEDETSYNADAGLAPMPTVQPGYASVGGKVPCIAEVAVMTATLIVDLWTLDLGARDGMVVAIEDALNPVEWMAGARLALDHYHGVHATYMLTGVTLAEEAAEGRQRQRNARFKLTAAAPMMRVFNLPRADVRQHLTVE